MLAPVALLDPLHGDGYQFWSGIGGGSPLFVIALLWWRHHNCHVAGCWRLHWRPVHDGSSVIVCRKHHPRPAAEITREHVRRRWLAHHDKREGA